MEPVSEEVFTQVPWFATGKTGQVDLNTSVNFQTNSSEEPEKRKSIVSLISRTFSRDSIKDSNSNNKLEDSSATRSAWQVSDIQEEPLENPSNSRARLPSLPRPSLPPSLVAFTTSPLQNNFNYDKGNKDRVEKMSTEEFRPQTRGKLDPNRYATKKTIGQGMLDIALLTSNASQLRYILQVGEAHEFYTAMLALVITSIVLQIIVACLFLIVGTMDINDEYYQQTGDFVNNTTLVLIFIITFINIVIAGFGIRHTDTAVAAKFSTTTASIVTTTTQSL
ncbi:uncharacterized protein LOC111712988 isoform X2 [Eurytemora carolleeae]|uniref:uncharacterized protein LOC111712988 isoform X2 n=1 Tax=Eurytemora carolleeae TaxID=1294199 RepID=UPI000C75A5FD|nr:uncharacterized protein LOC111712988 isoform X2 [Eurytemora carolleeae]|eukprot:XP_023343528.1 uncharacterized protein LOC111712988 isoform X2 [Eurytemora affinis]